MINTITIFFIHQTLLLNFIQETKFTVNKLTVKFELLRMIMILIILCNNNVNNIDSHLHYIYTIVVFNDSLFLE